MGKKIGPNPTDRGKGGVKRSLLTDGQGLPLSLVIDGAHRHDSMLLEETLAKIVIDRPGQAPRSWLCLDLGYIGRRIYDHVWQIGMVPWIRGRRDEAKPQREGARARRWVVERSHSWLNRYRRLIDSLGKTGRYLCGDAAICVWSNCLASRPSGIGSKYPVKSSL